MLTLQQSAQNYFTHVQITLKQHTWSLTLKHKHKITNLFHDLLEVALVFSQPIHRCILLQAVTLQIVPLIDAQRSIFRHNYLDRVLNPTLQWWSSKLRLNSRELLKIPFKLFTKTTFFARFSISRIQNQQNQNFGDYLQLKVTVLRYYRRRRQKLRA